MMLSVSPGYQLHLITPSVFSNIYDVVCVPRLSITINYPIRCSLTCMMSSVSQGYQLPLITTSVSLSFLMSVSPGYQLLFITPYVFSNVYDVVCVSGLSITLDYSFCVL